MPREKTYSHFVNDYPIPAAATADDLAKHWLFAAKAILVGSGLWSVVRSSDSVSVAATDLWGATFDATKLVRQTSTTAAAHSWVLLYCAGLSTWLVIDFAGAGTTPGQRACFTLFFTEPDAGTITVRPTSTDESAQIGYPYSSTLGKPFVEAVAVAHRMHAAFASDGSFFLLSSKNGSGAFSTLLGVWGLSDSRAGDPHRVAIYLDHHTTQLCRNVLHRLVSIPGTVPNDRNVGMRATKAESVTWGTLSFPFALMQDAQSPIFQLSGKIDPLSDSVNTAGIVVWGFVSTGWPPFDGETAYRGRIADFLFFHPGFAHGQVAPQTGAIEFVTCGDVLIPFNQAPTL